jgi:hypothetical protein
MIRLSSVVVVLVFNAVAVHADPIRVTSGGVFFQGGGETDMFFEFVSPEFAARGVAFGDIPGWSIVRIADPPIPRSGTLVDLSSEVSMGVGLESGGVFTGQIFSGEFSFKATRRGVLVCGGTSAFGDFNCEVTSPFAFTGTVAARDEEDRFLFARTLIGRGVAAASWPCGDSFGGECGGGGNSQFRYSFSAAPTPEPSTVVMLGIGSVILLRRHHTRRIAAKG